MEVFRDKLGRQIYAGDLLKSFHFTGPRKKKYWLYHVAVEENGRMEMVPTAHLSPDKINQGGRCPISKELADNCEIIDGFGPNGTIDYEYRPKIKA